MDEGLLFLSGARGGLLLQNTSRCKNTRVFLWTTASSLLRVEASSQRRSFPRIVRDMVAAKHSSCHTAAEMKTSDLSSAGDISLGVTTLVDSADDCFSIPSKKLRADPSSVDDRLAKAWKHWKRLGEPKLVVAPMVDQSELPFRMLCRKYGATAAYTPMLHSRLFADEAKYRSSEFTTCPEDRPLFVQFCSNDPEKLLTAAQIVEPHCDYVDINLGCPQRIAKRGNYGAFLMDDLPLVRSLVQKLASNLSVPVSCKIRIFPKLEDTLAYACMLEEAGCSLLAVHGRTREQKDSKSVRADWHAIKAVKQAVKIPVLANGNIRCLDDVHDCLRETGVDGVLSAESLLENPALFAGYRVASEVSKLSNGTLEEQNEMDMGPLDQPRLLLEYLDFFEKYPVPWRMVRAHVHRMLGNWFRIHPDLREVLNKEFKLSKEFLEGLVCSLINRKERIHLLPPSLPSEDSAKAPASIPIDSSILLDAAIIGGNEVGESLVFDGLGNSQTLSKDSRSTASMKMIGGLELS